MEWRRWFTRNPGQCRTAMATPENPTDPPTDPLDQQSDLLAEDGGTVRPFASILLGLNRSKTHDELSRAVQEVTAAVRETGRKGSISFTMTIAPMKGSEQLLVTDDVTVRPPKHDRAANIFYADDDDNLVRDDPNQAVLPVRLADSPVRPLRGGK